VSRRASYLLERAWVGGRVRDDVLVEVENGRFTAVSPGPRSPDPAERTSSPGHTAHRVQGLTLPGLANCHSHAFHRALRGRVQRGGGTFWTWREQMYAVAGRLDPDRYFALAMAVYRELVAAGFTAVGEFHYLHHQPDGTPYADPNVMGLALVEAAREAGIRIALLDTCYLSAGFGEPVTGVQVRYCDGDAHAWAERAEALRGAVASRDDVLVGAAVHSVRAVPRDQLPTVVDWARRAGAPLHVHLSEQPAENDGCRAAYGRTPTEVLHEAGALGPATSAVHATHLTAGDIRLLGAAAATACLCPTTERDLGDGIGPAPELRAAGVRLTLGSDSHAVADGFEEMRAVELDERLRSRARGRIGAAELLSAATADGHAGLGFPDCGEIAVGNRADLVTVDTTSPRTAGTGADEHTAVFAATAEDVVQVMVGGRIVATREDRARIGRELADVINGVWADRRARQDQPA
jgi:formiminoglutamate deiminase